MTTVSSHFSVVIPTRNRPELLKHCLNSLLRQRFGLKEIIIVDVSDNKITKEVVKGFDKLLNIRYFHIKDTNYPHVYNTGIKKVKSKYIAFLNDDCWVEKDWSAKICKNLKKYPDNILQAQVIPQNGSNLYVTIMENHYRNWVKSHLNKGYFDCLDLKATIMPGKYFYKGKTYRGFDERLRFGSEDIAFGQELFAEGKIIKYCPDIRMHHQERTTFRGFIQQHIRIAKAEGMITRITEYGNVDLFPKKKTLANIRTFINLEAAQIRKTDIQNSIKLPFLYLCLLVTRIYGYYLWPKISKSV